MIVVTCEQRTSPWYQARVGRVTGSRAKLLTSFNKDKSESAGRRDYRMQLVLERIVGQPQEDGYVNADMQRGIDLEPAAFAAYEALTGEVVSRIGFAQHDELMAGCSPDGLVGEHGLLSIKCPRPANHFAYIKAKMLPDEHKIQCVHECWITGAKWVDFLSFCPALPKLETFLVRYQRNEAELAAHELIVRQFLREVERELAEIQALQGVA